MSTHIIHNREFKHLTFFTSHPKTHTLGPQSPKVQQPLAKDPSTCAPRPESIRAPSQKLMYFPHLYVELPVWEIDENALSRAWLDQVRLCGAAGRAVGIKDVYIARLYPRGSKFTLGNVSMKRVSFASFPARPPVRLQNTAAHNLEIGILALFHNNSCFNLFTATR